MKNRAKKILIAVGDSADSKNAVEYVAKMLSHVPNTLFTLFTLESWIPESVIEGAKGDPEAKDQIGPFIHKNRDAADRLVNEMKALMVQSGVSEDRIKMIAEPIRQGMAKDVLSRATKGRYDAIVIGRRGLTPTKDFFIGTTAAKIVEHALELPVWVVDEDVVSKNVLLPVDSSDGALKTVKYVLDMIGGTPDVNVTLFHVLPHLRHYFSLTCEKENRHLEKIIRKEDEHQMEVFLERVKGLADTPPIDLDLKVKMNSYDVSTAILDEARTGQYGTIAVGRRGERNAYFSGKVPMRLIQKLSGPVLWVVP